MARAPLTQGSLQCLDEADDVFLLQFKLVRERLETPRLEGGQ